MKKLISIVPTSYNEEKCIDKFYEEVSKTINQIDKYDFEVIITENGSYDSTYKKLIEINRKDSRFKIVKVARNCGSDGGISASLKHAKGEAAIITYTDLEDPPYLIFDFIKKWEEGYKNVYGIVKSRNSGFLRRFNSQLFYFLINKLTKNIIPKNISDYRLIDKSVYEVFNSIKERNKFLRALFAWMGFKSIGIEYKRVNRAGGKSKASTLHVLALATRGIFSYSVVPLRIASVIGLTTSVLSFLGIMFFVTQYLFFGKFPPFAGFGTIICVILLMFGILFFLIGIVGEYIGMIYDEVKGRPQFIVDELIGIEKKD